MRHYRWPLFALTAFLAACTGNDPIDTCVLDLDCGDPALGWRCIEQECYQVAVDDDTAGGDIMAEKDENDIKDEKDDMADEDSVVSDLSDESEWSDESDESDDLLPDEPAADEDLAGGDTVAEMDGVDDMDTVDTTADEDTVVADDATVIDQDTALPDVDTTVCGDTDDCDGDGWTPAQGDCCDTIADCADPELVNPGAVEVEGDTIDNDCNGDTDEEPTLCSTAQKFAAIGAIDLLNAMDICKTAANGSWGIVGTPTLLRTDGDPIKCTYSLGCGDPLYQKSVIDKQTAVMEQFGTDASNIALRGATMSSLSSGRARDANDPDPTNDDTFEWEVNNNNAPPADFTAAHGGDLPTTKSGCPAGEGANDSVELSFQIKVPTNAHSFSFNFRFFSQEYRRYTCSQFNDFFIAMLYSGAAGIPADKNVSFDTNSYYISVNTDQFFTVCTPKTGYTCPDGTAALDGTGYGDTYMDPIGRTTYGGGTKWLTTTAPVIPGETITIKFAIWDTGDTQVDSLVLIDNFKWSAQGTGGGPTTFECWDLDQDTICDPEEELSGDSLCTERDCG